MDDYKYIDLGGLRDYQNFARVTAIYPELDSIYGLFYTTLGLCGEAGEVAEKVKKLYRDTAFEDIDTYEAGKYPPHFVDSMVKELGDVLWYLANICEELGLELSDVAKYNLEKLYSRKERGVLHGSGDNR